MKRSQLRATLLPSVDSQTATVYLWKERSIYSSVCVRRPSACSASQPRDFHQPDPRDGPGGVHQRPGQPLQLR